MKRIPIEWGARETPAKCEELGGSVVDSNQHQLKQLSVLLLAV